MIGEDLHRRSNRMIPVINLSGVRFHVLPELDIPDLPNAACKGIDNPDIFHPHHETAKREEAVELCFSCPVQQACFDYAMERERKYGSIGGTWGGYTEWERRALREGDVKMCRKGKHEMTGDNVRDIGNGYTRCRACHLDSTGRSQKTRRLQTSLAGPDA